MYTTDHEYLKQISDTLEKMYEINKAVMTSVQAQGANARLEAWVRVIYPLVMNTASLNRTPEQIMDLCLVEAKRLITAFDAQTKK